MSVSHSIPSSDRRWLKVLVAGAALVTVTFGIRQVFGLFVVPISTELGGGVQTIALAIAVQNLIWGFSSPLFGAMADRIGAWKVAILGAAIYTAGLLSTAYIVSPGGVFLGQALIGLGLGSAGISIAIGAVGRVVPPGRRSIAFGLVTSFGSFGQFALLPVTQMMIGTYGWQQALVILSFLMAAMTAMALGMRTDQQAKTAGVARELSTGEALRVAVLEDNALILRGYEHFFGGNGVYLGRERGEAVGFVSTVMGARPPFDAVVLDENLDYGGPGFDESGSAVAGRLRAAGFAGFVIICTGGSDLTECASRADASHFLGQHQSHRGFTQAWRAIKQHMVQGLLPPLSRLHSNTQHLLQLRLTDVVRQASRSEPFIGTDRHFLRRRLSIQDPLPTGLGSAGVGGDDRHSGRVPSPG